MKKLLVLLSILLLLFGCSSSPRGPIKIKAKEMPNLLKSNEIVVFYLGSSVCSACKEYKPIISELVKNYDVKFYYVEANTDDTEDLNDLIDNYLGIVEYTPHTFIFRDGKLKESRVGVIEYLDLKEWLEDLGVIIL